MSSAQKRGNWVDFYGNDVLASLPPHDLCRETARPGARVDDPLWGARKDPVHHWQHDTWRGQEQAKSAPLTHGKKGAEQLAKRVGSSVDLVTHGRDFPATWPGRPSRRLE
jgi:hypothetical protein